MGNTNSPAISTHVLDTTLGVPAEGVSVTLWRVERSDKALESTQKTNHDGRIANLLSGELTAGHYRISFDVASYLARQRDEEPFFRNVVIDFDVTDVERKYHVPLLISPYMCTSYRGS